jgi:hypothetical protein
MKHANLTKWYRMDNSGMIYPIIGTLSTQSNFMLRFRLKEPIDRDLLTEALLRTYDRFPYFKVTIERGLFRHYLVENPRTPKVWQADGVILGRTAFAQNGYYPIWVSYWANSVFVTFFHGLSDGHGATRFVCYLLSTYLKLAHPETYSPETDPDLLFARQDNETENAYDTYYARQPFFKGLSDTAGGNAAQVKGRFFVKDGLACTEGRINVQEALAVARQKGCTLTELMAAAGLMAAVRTRAKCTPKQQPKVFIPVNLRKMFPSETMFNFVGIIKCCVPQSTPTLEDYIALIKAQLAEQNTREAFMPKLAFTSLFSKNPLLRSLPLSVKILVSKLGRALTKSTKQTMIMSNLGRVPLPKPITDHIEDFAFTLNANRRTPQNLAMISCGDNLSVCWSRHIVENDIDREFYAIMRSLGLDMVVNGNYREVEYAL